MSKLIHRVTLFKIADESDQEKLLQIYQQMQNKALKVCLESPIGTTSQTLTHSE